MEYFVLRVRHFFCFTKEYKQQIETVNNCKVLVFIRKLNVFVVKFSNNASNINKNELFELVQESVSAANIYFKLGDIKNILISVLY